MGHDAGMEIIPGRGVRDVRIDQHRRDVKGYTSTPSDIGHEFHAGFAVFSMGSCSARDLDPNASEEDERLISEGVSVAPYEYFTN